MSSKEKYRIELRTAIRQLSDRCLYAASKWAAEQLVGIIEQDPVKFTRANTRFQRGSSSIRRRFRTNDITPTSAAGVSYVSTPVMEEDDIVDGILTAGSTEELLMCFVIRTERSRALYLAGEKRKEEEMMELEGPLGKSDVVNGELVSLERELSTLRKNPILILLDSTCMALCSKTKAARVLLLQFLWSLLIATLGTGVPGRSCSRCALQLMS
ncbi:anaphase-promoting complex subunit 8 isoform X2 [Pyrus x bretschneideri]|uniref:anaphase-promoting complex subunit 8 isoform X2 n=1 Tax=Pyrus x bretschneideri TaxID=225117 RepID=UPI00202F77D8|nr:anaphase-promoting complex subunit 8 isoform X2 [Pyrus x bretschneideri]